MTNEDEFDSLDRGQDDEWVSKTRRKKEMHALQDLGKKLVELSGEQLEKVPLEADLRAAVVECRRLTKHEAIRRQLQYIGRLMRQSDAEAIAEAMERFEAGKQAHDAFFHRLERWRDRLINGDNGDLAAFVEEYAGADVQHLRQLVRNAQKELQQQKPPASARKLFRYIRELAENA